MDIHSFDAKAAELAVSELFELSDPSDLYSVFRALHESDDFDDFMLAYAEIRQAEDFFLEALEDYDPDMPAVRGMKERFAMVAEATREALARRLREVMGEPS